MSGKPLCALTFAAFSVAALAAQTTVGRRADSLLQRMTLDEKIGQLTQLFYGIMPDTVAPEERVRKGQIGSFLMISDPAVMNRLQKIAMEESRLHVPILFGFDVIHGWHTIFPVPLAMAASWDPALIERVQTIAAREASAAGVRWTFAPMVDIARDARWGRIVEGAGEDPFLGSAVARAQVRGFQGPAIGSPEHVLACVKHFAAYGAADGGRDYDSVYVSDANLHNVYLRPFHAAQQAGAATFMSAYMDLNDVPATANRFLLEDVLRKDWGFRGFVVSDAFAVANLAIQGFARDPKDAAFRALTAGVQMDMGSKTYLEQLATLVREGKVSIAEIDNAVRSILIAKYELGLFETPYVDEARAKQILNAPEHRQQARIAAQRAAVLLRNEGGLLPLKKDSPGSIAIIGSLANSKTDLRGPWALADDPNEVVTVVEGIRNKTDGRVKVEYAAGVEMHRRFPSFFDAILNIKKPTPPTDAERENLLHQAVDLAKRSGVAVLVLGEAQDMSGEAASRASLDLPSNQQQLLEAVVATGRPVVLVLVNGRPLNLSWASQHVAAILEAWYPGGQAGNAIADLLFGDANPGGKLPVTWPRSAGQAPIYYAHNLSHQPPGSPMYNSRYWDLETTPLYPFGYGLSYTQFGISNLKLKQAEVKIGQPVEASVDVQNTGNRAGDEVVQLYIHQQAGSASRPVRELKGFERVSLAPGEKRTVHFTLGKDELSYWSAQEKKWVMERETFDVWAGSDSDASLHVTFKVN